jgi:hypothetical protein
MKFLLFVFALSLNAAPRQKPEKLALPRGPVKAALKKNYRLHLARNFAEEAEKEIQLKYVKKQGS